MSFEPFDTGLVAQQLRSQVPALQHVGGAADYAAVKELRGFRTPSAYVIFAEEANTGSVKDAIGQCTLEASVQFGVVLALRHWREQQGEQMADDTRRLVGQVRAALVGHKPTPKGVRVIGWESGKVLDYDASVLLFADVYRLNHVMHRGDA